MTGWAWLGIVVVYACTMVVAVALCKAGSDRPVKGRWR